MKLAVPVITLSVVVICVHGDMYLHNPRGSNNRLNEASTARANANRLFDSQVGEKKLVSNTSFEHAGLKLTPHVHGRRIA